MIAILKKFFDFCATKNRRMFYHTLLIGVLIGVCEACKFPAIYLVVDGFLNKSISPSKILYGFLILLGAVVVETFLRAGSTLLQCKAGYRECAEKRIEIARHLRYLPMGYFNDNNLGEITSVTTNIMEQLGDVATRIVMLTTQGMLNTAIIVFLIFIFDWRIGLICLLGIILFSLINQAMRKANQKSSQQKVEMDTKVIILDEATANIDPENEKDLMEAIEALTKQKTILMIAHRLKTVRNADQIFVVDKGRITQHGTHQELINQSGIYKQFIHSKIESLGWKIE